MADEREEMMNTNHEHWKLRLADCPFCGYAAGMEANGICYWVECKGCCMRGISHAEPQTAADEWNRRVPAQGPVEPGPAREELDAESAFPVMLRRARKAQGLTQEALGARVGLLKAAIANYENGHRSPSIAGLRDLCDGLRVSADYLLARSPIPPVPAPAEAREPGPTVHAQPLTEEEKEHTRTVSRDQFVQMKGKTKVTCGGCARAIPVRFSYRCLYCMISFCEACAGKHFGKTRADYIAERDAAREEKMGAGSADASPMAAATEIQMAQEILAHRPACELYFAGLGFHSDKPDAYQAEVAINYKGERSFQAPTLGEAIRLAHAWVFEAAQPPVRPQAEPYTLPPSSSHPAAPADGIPWTVDDTAALRRVFTAMGQDFPPTGDRG